MVVAPATTAYPTKQRTLTKARGYLPHIILCFFSAAPNPLSSVFEGSNTQN